MEIRSFGNSGFAVPTVGMGTFRTFDVSGHLQVEHCRRIVDAALADGCNLFDSSPMYGEAEYVLARAIKGRRKETIVATKVWSGSAAEGRRQIQRALEWYDGYVDIYQIHNLVAWKEHLPFLEDLQAEGKIKIIGLTHYSHFSFDELIRIMRTGRIQQIQIPYNVTDTVVEQEVLPTAHELGIGVLAMRPLGQGALLRRQASAEKLEPIERYGVKTWAQAMIKWILSDFRVHSVIPATSQVEHAIQNAAAGAPPWFDQDARAYVQRVVTSV
jgi:aryl-alcohol dehydrogenase-like predicted oxidoreductase